jgi:hypothetical protein
MRDVKLPEEGCQKEIVQTELGYKTRKYNCKKPPQKGCYRMCYKKQKQ